MKLALSIVLVIALAKSGVSKDSADQDEGEIHRDRRAAKWSTVATTISSLQQKFKSVSSNARVLSVLQKINSSVAALAQTNSPVTDNLEKLANLADSINSNWLTLTGSDSIKIAASVTDVLGTVGGFAPPPYGPIISALAGIVSAILGIFGGTKSTAQIVEEVIDKKLKEQYKRQLEGQISGALKEMDLSQVFLDWYQGEQMTSGDFIFLVSQFRMLQNVPLAGALEDYIETLSKSKKKEEAANALDLIDAYVAVTSMTELLMHSMKSILHENNSTLSANSVGAVIALSRQHTKAALSFFRKPNRENAMTIALYNPDQRLGVEALINSLGIPETTIDPGFYNLKSNYNQKMVLAYSDMAFRMFLMGRNFYSKFQFTKLGKYWRVTTSNKTVCGVNRAMTITNCPTDGAALDFRIVAFTDGGYLVVNRAWPFNPLWMWNLNIGVDKDQTGMLVGGPLSANGGPSMPGDFFGVAFAYYMEAASDDKTDWNTNNPEYIWLLEKTA